MSKLQWLSISFIFIGVLFLSFSFFNQLTVIGAQDNLNEDWDILNRSYAAAEGSGEPVKVFKRNLAVSKPPEENSNRDEIFQKGIAGQLRIPSIDLDVMVVPGVEEENLKNAVGWLPSTSLPEEGSNMAIAGHGNQTYGELFHRIGEMEIGDKIYLDTLSGEHTFEVYEILVVEPEDVWVIDPTDATEVTLITCESLYSDENRLIIKAEKIHKSEN